MLSARFVPKFGDPSAELAVLGVFSIEVLIETPAAFPLKSLIDRSFGN
jgi:hypothetical protein